MLHVYFVVFVAFLDMFQVSLENGMVQGFDIRTASSDPASETKPTFTLHAHEKAVCTISYNPSASNVHLIHLSRSFFFDVYISTWMSCIRKKYI